MKGRTEFIAMSVLLFLLSACSSNQTEKQQEMESTITRLQEMESLDITMVSASVASIQKELARDRQIAENGVINYQEVFSNTVVMGDSIAAGLDEYGLLNTMQVVAARGRNLDTIEEDIAKVIQIAPTHIFFSYGMNDLGYCNGQTDLFIERYRSVIATISEALPNTKLHINAILPIQQHAIDENPLYAYYTDFNNAMKAMCEELHLDFIDNSSIIVVHEIPYNPDGVHPIYDFYPYWLDHMAERL